MLRLFRHCRPCWGCWVCSALMSYSGYWNTMLLFLPVYSFLITLSSAASVFWWHSCDDSSSARPTCVRLHWYELPLRVRYLYRSNDTNWDSGNYWQYASSFLLSSALPIPILASSFLIYCLMYLFFLSLSLFVIDARLYSFIQALPGTYS